MKTRHLKQSSLPSNTLVTYSQIHAQQVHSFRGNPSSISKQKPLCELQLFESNKANEKKCNDINEQSENTNIITSFHCTENPKIIPSSSRIVQIDQSIGLDTQQSVFAIAQDIQQMTLENMNTEQNNYIKNEDQFEQVQDKGDQLSLSNQVKLDEEREFLRKQIYFLTNNLSDLNFKYQNLIYENDQLKQQNGDYNQNDMGYSKLLQKHQQELCQLQQNWNKERTQLVKAVNQQKLRILDNELIMFQMEGDLQRVKSYMNKNHHSNTCHLEIKPFDSSQPPKQPDTTAQLNKESSSTLSQLQFPLSSHSSKKVSTTPQSRPTSVSKNSPNNQQNKRFGSVASTAYSELSCNKYLIAFQFLWFDISKVKRNACSNSTAISPVKSYVVNSKLMKAIFSSPSKISQKVMNNINRNNSKQSIKSNRADKPNSAQLFNVVKRNSLGNCDNHSPLNSQTDNQNQKEGQQPLKKNAIKNSYHLQTNPIKQQQQQFSNKSHKVTKSQTDLHLRSNKFPHQSIDQSVQIFKRFQNSLHLLD